ncbi:MAG: glycosyltransferase family 2 protein [Eubacterium sp.]
MADLLSIVVPCYNEEEALPYLIPELDKVTKDIDADIEIILIDDGSADGTREFIKKVSTEDKRIKYISFSRNFGKEAAIFAGLEHSAGDYVVIMDADMQDKPELLPQMYRLVAEEGYDSVATRRVTRKGEPPIRSFFARCFYRIINKISKTEFVDGARDYRMMNRKFVNALLEMKEYNRFSKGLYGWVGFNTKWLEYENVERVAGETKWSFWGLFKYSIEGIVAFSTAPLILASVLGFIFCIIAFAAIIFVVIRRLVFGDAVAGWASLVCIITLLGGLQLFTTGILGQYIAKMYLETKDRPIYIVDESNIK